MSNRTPRRAPQRRTRWTSRVLLLAAVCIAAGTAGAAQQHYPGLGTIGIEADPTEFLLDAPPGRVEAIATRYGLTVLRALDDHAHGVFLVRGPASIAPEELVRQVSADPEVRHFEINALAVAPETPGGITLNQSPLEILDSTSDRTLIDYFGQQAWSRYATQPATAAIRLPSAHATVTGNGIVAIIDTGVDPTHPLLAGVLVPGYDFVNETAAASEWADLDPSTTAVLNQSPLEILDSASSAVPINQSTAVILGPDTAQALSSATLPPAFGHGTMVAGLVHLVAPTAKIMPLKAFRADGSSRVFDIVRAIYFAVENGARVINMSFSTVALSPEVTHAINYATDRGVICVSSVGNSGKELLVYPAALRNVLGIGSVTSTDPPERSTFSNYGDALVRLAAPGGGLITTYPGGKYAGAWGTSFSAALVSGAAALLAQKHPTLDQQTAADYLGKADRMKFAGMGRGRLNLYDAVRQLADSVAPTISFLTPAAGAALQGSVTVSASASDNVSVAGVKFLLDDRMLGVEDTAAPYEVTWNTASAANGSHVLMAIARDADGNQTSSTLTVTVSNDSGAPTVAVTSPAAGATVSGSVTLTASATDDVGVASVQFFLDGVALGAADVNAPYELTWTTTAVVNGTHTITAVASDAAGNSATATAITVTVTNDTTAPTVSITSPAAGATVSGSATLTASATDDVGVASVQFFVDGVALGQSDTAAPYVVPWTTTAAANGTYTITAVARDTAGNDATATAITVTVANDTTAPAISVTSPANGTTVSGTVTLTATATDDVGILDVQFFVDGVAFGAAHSASPYALPWVTTSVANGSHVVTAIARDAAGNQATAAAVTVTVSNDTTAPTVSVTSPAAGVTISGTVTLVAAATDDVGVASVQFFLDGVALGAADVEGPYELAWTTTTVANGTHTITAVARDAAGNEATAAAVTVTVNNDTTAPTVSLASPEAGTTVSGTVTLAATATDDVGVASVQFFLDGVPLGAADTEGPYELSWSTLDVANGEHTLTAVARDAAGNQTTSASVVVIVAN